MSIYRDAKLQFLEIAPPNTTDKGLKVSGTVELSSDLTVGGDTIITGDLTVNGTTTTVATSTVVHEDPVIVIGGTVAPASDDGKDRGIEFHYHDGSSARTGFMGWDNSGDTFSLLSATTNLSEVISGTAAPLTMGVLTAATGSTVGDLTLADGSITSSSAAITFGNENLSTTGTLGCGVLTAATGSAVGNLTLANGSITDSSGAISFGDENLSTTGTLGCGAITTSGALAVTGTITGDTSLTLDAVTITTAEIGVLDSVTAGTAAASKALVLDANKDIGTIRNLTIDGTFSDGNYTFDTSGNVSGLGTVSCGTLSANGVCRTNFKRYAAFTCDLSTLDGSSVNFGAGDVLFNLGALDVTNADGITGTLIIIEKAIINVTTAAGTALNTRLDLSSDAGTAVNSGLANNTEVVGAGATYADGGSTVADVDLNSAACSVITANSQSAIAKIRLYLVTETALSANVTQGAVNISVEYSVI